MKHKFLLFFCALSLFQNLLAQTTAAPFIVDPQNIKAPIQPTMWGVFFEDINFGADGGLYAELVKNRSFEFPNPLMGWKEQKQPDCNILIVNRNNAQAANKRFARISVQQPNYGITNEGFRGMGIQQNKHYNFSVWASLYNGSPINLKVQLVASNGDTLGTTALQIDTKHWKQYKAVITATRTDAKAKLNVWLEGKGVVDVDMISLFPEDTWKKRPGGLRADLVQLLADMKPGFIRFPGGCIVEGRDLTNRYQWKKTLGNAEDRELMLNRWNNEFSYRSAPDYFQSFGLGFFEYFQLAEDIGASPLPILNCGMACQFNTAEVVDTVSIDPYVQDVLDLVEFANGSIKTKWGKRRAVMGHPEPFKLKMIGIGNENWGAQYIERATLFKRIIKAKYPEIQLVFSAGPSPDDARFHYLNGELRKMKADMIDEHYYKSPSWFLQNAQRYDHYNTEGPKVFAGEYAAHHKPTGSSDNKNTWLSALAEAAFMTGLERNAGVVHMASYAPLFAHEEAWQWSPDLIWMNNLQSYGTPNYYVQQLFSLHKGTHVVSILANGNIVAGKDSLYATACIDKSSRQLIIKIVNISSKSKQQPLQIASTTPLESYGKCVQLACNDLQKLNSFSDPKAICPLEKKVEINNNTLELSLPAYSLQIICLPMR